MPQHIPADGCRPFAQGRRGPVPGESAAMVVPEDPSGAFERAMSVMTLRERTLPPTAGFHGAGPACRIGRIPHAARPATVSTIPSNGFASGGPDAARVVRRV